jgi:hypothetical protein
VSGVDHPGIHRIGQPGPQFHALTLHPRRLSSAALPALSIRYRWYDICNSFLYRFWKAGRFEQFPSSFYDSFGSYTRKMLFCQQNGFGHQKITGSKSKIVHIDQRPNQTLHEDFDVSKAKIFSNGKPKPLGTKDWQTLIFGLNNKWDYENL